MGECGSCGGGGGGPFSEGRELVEFVYGAHDGAIKDLPIAAGSLEAKCQGCGSCAAECPGKAIQLQHCEDEEIIAKASALFKVEAV